MVCVETNLLFFGWCRLQDGINCLAKVQNFQKPHHHIDNAQPGDGAAHISTLHQLEKYVRVEVAGQVKQEKVLIPV